MSAFESAEAIVRYALAGRATLTLESERTGARYTYRITRRDDAPAFVSVLTGPENTRDYTYLGTVFVDGEVPVYRHGRKSEISPGAPSARAFAWAWDAFVAGRIPEGLSVYHEGQCGRCGRALTVPESILTGLGPHCAEEI